MLCSPVKVYEDLSKTWTNFQEAMPLLQKAYRETIPALEESGCSVSSYTATHTFTIVAGEHKTLLAVTAREATPAFALYRQHVLDEIKKYTLEIAYSDIYNEHLESLNRDFWGT